MIKYPLETIICCILVGILSIFVIISQNESAFQNDSSIFKYFDKLPADGSLASKPLIIAKKIVVTGPKYSSSKGIFTANAFNLLKTFKQAAENALKEENGIGYEKLCFKANSKKCFSWMPFKDTSSVYTSDEELHEEQVNLKHLLDVRNDSNGNIIGASSAILTFFFSINSKAELNALVTWNMKVKQLGTKLFEPNSKSLSSVQMLIRMFKVR